MNDTKKNSTENEKSSYNINSFRGVYTDKNREKEVKIHSNVLSPRLIIPSSEKNEKETERSKQSIKPRLLTGKLPSAFDVKYRRYDMYFLNK